MRERNGSRVARIRDTLPGDRGRTFCSCTPVSLLALSITVSSITWLCPCPPKVVCRTNTSQFEAEHIAEALLGLLDNVYGTARGEGGGGVMVATPREHVKVRDEEERERMKGGCQKRRPSRSSCSRL